VFGRLPDGRKENVSIPECRPVTEEIAKLSIRIHAISTGSVRVKKAQRVRKPGGLVRVMTDSEWTESLPIYAWVIDHPEGVIVVDSGETARTSQAGYFPAWHPYYRWSVRTDVKPAEEIGPQLREMGIEEKDVATLILTHFHTDHAGGLHHFPESRILVSGDDLQLAGGRFGRLLGYLPHRWPQWFDPTPIPFEPESYGPFDQSFTVTDAGDVVIVPTPGHTPNHVSVIVRDNGVDYFLAGDTSYTQQLLEQRTPDGISLNADITLATMDRILSLARERPLVYVPSHDVDSADRLAQIDVLKTGTNTEMMSARHNSEPVPAA
jgi:glyoxylase-like metal-dependent hydrolase (beta-lactamase superfamily II)